MIERITELAPYKSYIDSFKNDDMYSDPMLATEEEMECNLFAAVTRPGRLVLGVFDGGEITGLFTLLVIPEEKYMEMLTGLSRVSSAYDELLRYLEENYPDYNADFVFNPKNDLLKDKLDVRGALFETEQQRMVFTHRLPQADTRGVELLSPRYMDQYLTIHGTDMYWTGEKVAEATERFRTLLAVDDGNVVGYMDVTHCYKENEPYDLFVRPEYRRKGWGRKLLARALAMNEPKDMMLLVEIDNEPAIRLYEGMGFIKKERQNSLTVHWKIA
ncbi:MAG: GNAT family N-acetyltransferase [Oscillospiraceae bacterium]|nr:GNAT family N-acetyltransferase [Oscillospiraceae bacterium]